MLCNGNCGICGNPCFRGEVRYPVSQEEELGASKAFDSPLNTENGLSIIEDAGTYEVTKNIFGIEKVRRVK